MHNNNHKWILATVFFWALGTYFLTAGHLDAAVQMDDPFDHDRK